MFTSYQNTKKLSKKKCPIVISRVSLIPSDQTFKVPKNEPILKESTSKRNLPVEPEQGKPQKRRRSIRNVFKGGKNHK